jgi:hypothetical protein
VYRWCLSKLGNAAKQAGEQLSHWFRHIHNRVGINEFRPKQDTPQQQPATTGPFDGTSAHKSKQNQQHGTSCNAAPGQVPSQNIQMRVTADVIAGTTSTWARAYQNTKG